MQKELLISQDLLGKVTTIFEPMGKIDINSAQDKMILSKDEVTFAIIVNQILYLRSEDASSMDPSLIIHDSAHYLPNLSIEKLVDRDHLECVDATEEASVVYDKFLMDATKSYWLAKKAK